MTVREYIETHNEIIDYDASMQNLEYVDFSGKTLTRVNFEGSSLRYANFAGSKVTSCNFLRCDIRNVKGDGVAIRTCSIDGKDVVLIGQVLAIGCTQTTLDKWQSRSTVENKIATYGSDAVVYAKNNIDEIKKAVEGWICQSL